MQLESDLLSQLWINWKWFLKAINVFSLFRNKGGSSVNRHDFLLPKGALCKVWPRFAQWFWGIFLKCWQCILAILLLIIAPLERVDFSFAKAVLSLFWLKLFQLVWRRTWRCERFTDRQADRQTDKRRSEKLTGASSSVKLKIVTLINMSRQYHWRDMKKGYSLVIYNKPFDANSTSRQENFIYTCTTICSSDFCLESQEKH